MSKRQWSNDAENHVILGMKGQGKSTLQRQCVRSFKGKLLVFDHKGEFADFFRGHPCKTFAEASAALRQNGGCLCYPGDFTTLEDMRAKFLTWCEWAWTECRRLPGRKMIVWDESGIVLDANARSYESHPHFKIMLDGRSWGIDTLGTAHAPADLPPDARNQTTRLTTFRLQSATAAGYLTKDFGLSVDAIQALPKGQFLQWHNGDVRRGKVVFGK